jgi:hypothetical protein
LQFFRFYMGLYNNSWPDLHVQDFPAHYMKGSRVHVSPSCSSAAVSFSNALFNHRAPLVQSGANFTLLDSTIWYSKGSWEEARRVIEAAEASRDEGALLCLFRIEKIVLTTLLLFLVFTFPAYDTGLATFFFVLWLQCTTELQC